jgi:hypothetical protein
MPIVGGRQDRDQQTRREQPAQPPENPAEGDAREQQRQAREYKHETDKPNSVMLPERVHFLTTPTAGRGFAPLRRSKLAIQRNRRTKIYEFFITKS